MVVSFSTIGLFAIPLATSWLFNWPKHAKAEKETIGTT
jgi:hypothetical protein